MKPIAYLFLVLSLPHLASAQEDIPLLLPEERRAVKVQKEQFNEAISPALKDAAKSTVRVWAGSRRLAYGTVVGNGSQVLSKWSEIARSEGTLRVGAEGDYRGVTVAGVYEAEDLVLLNVEGKPLTPIQWSLETPKLGSFIAAPQPDGRLAAFGVVSVLERNLRDTDMAYLGVIADQNFKGQGVRVSKVQDDSGAFAAGLKPGDVLLKVGERTISGLLELKNSLTGINPGTTIDIVANVDGKMKTIPVLLGNRPELPTQFAGDRLRVMERMGGPISRVRDSFGHAVQTDMKPNPNQIGGPVVDLKGRAFGITMARADRTRSFVMPAAAINELLKTPAEDPVLVKTRQEQQTPRVVTRGSGPGSRGRPQPGSEERLRRHLSDMQRLMDYMREEMDMLENP